MCPDLVFSDAKNREGYTAWMERGKKLVYLLLGIGLLLGLFVISRYNYLLFHVIAELFSIAVAWSVFLLVWNVRRYIDNDALIFLGVAYLYVGLLDMLHTLAFKGMDIFTFIQSANPATQLWICARGLEAFSLLCFPLLWKKRLQPQFVLWLFAALSALLLFSIFMWDFFPVCYIPGSGLTGFKIGSEIVICLVLLLAIFFLHRLRQDFDAIVYRLIVIAMLLTIGAELAFSMYTQVYGMSNLIGHYCKIVSFFLVYFALIRCSLTRPYAVLFRDLDREKEKVRKSEEQFRMTFNSIQEGVITCDTSGRIVQINPMAQKLTGCTAQESTEVHIVKIFRTYNFYSKEKVKNPVLEVLNTGETYILPDDIGLLTKEGKELPIAGSISPLRGLNAHIIGVALVFYDISEQKHAEKLRKDVERIMRHNLKSPLNSLIGMSQLLEMEKESLSPEQMEYISYISDSAYKMLYMIDHSVDMFQIEEGTYQLRPVKFNLVEVLADLDREISQQKQFSSLKLRYFLNGSPLDWQTSYFLQGEQIKIRSMLTNLLSNALESSPEQATVSVSVYQLPEGHRIDIHNQGEIPEDVKDRFFEPYVSSGKKYGTGLGTHSAWLIARAHGGEIKFFSSQEEGTRVSVFIPE